MRLTTWILFVCLHFRLFAVEAQSRKGEARINPSLECECCRVQTMGVKGEIVFTAPKIDYVNVLNLNGNPVVQLWPYNFGSNSRQKPCELEST